MEDEEKLNPGWGYLIAVIVSTGLFCLLFIGLRFLWRSWVTGS